MARASEGKPNVVLILVDDLGYGDLSSYGAPDMRTPHVDGLMSAGMRFDSFYANCPVCSPTRASVLTGRYPDLVGVPGVIRTHRRNSWGHLTAGAVMLPTVLAKAGYETAIVGKWHLGLASPNTPNERGFDHFHGFLGDMMDNYYNHRRHGNNYMRLDGKEIDPKGHATDLFTQWAVEYIRKRAPSRSRSGARSGSRKPFFLYLAYNAPHTPIQPPREWVDRVKKREQGIGKRRAALVAFIEHLDDGIGKVVSAIRESGLGDDTVIIFTSDNGGQASAGARNAPFRGGKQTMFEGGIRVPACVVWPGRIKAGSGSDIVAATSDLFPTICEAAGARFDHEIDGRSFLATLLGGPQAWPDRYLFWVRLEGGRYRGKPYYAARHGDWKLLQNNAREPYKLYNLKEDPGEKRDLGKDHPQYARLNRALQEHIRKASRVPWRRPEG